MACSGGTTIETAEPNELVDSDKVFVAAASDLRFAFTDIGERFRTETGVDVVFTFGSSGQLREQILNGAPFDVFASANEQFVTDVVDAGRGVATSVQPYAFGRIVLRTREGLDVPATLNELTGDEFSRIAIANPAHAPYGIAARESLVAIGVYDQIEDRLIFGENVSDTLRLVETGNVDAAIVALSLVINASSRYQLIDESLHQPLKQSLVLTNDGEKNLGAQKFVEFLSSTEGRAAMNRYGFVLPEGQR